MLTIITEKLLKTHIHMHTTSHVTYHSYWLVMNVLVKKFCSRCPMSYEKFCSRCPMSYEKCVQ